MAINWNFADAIIELQGIKKTISLNDGMRQQMTARSIVDDFRTKPGVILSDEVGMGKTYVALAVVASVLLSTKNDPHPVVVMLPPGLIDKWQRDWEDFKSLCCRDAAALNGIRAKRVENPTDLFKLINEGRRKRARLVWMTTSCFHAGLNDGWLKLAFVRIARSNSRLSDESKRRIYKWATEMSRLKSKRDLTPEVIEQLMHREVSDWHSYLKREGILEENSDNPIPSLLLQYRNQLNWSELARFLREDVPGRQGAISPERLAETRREFKAHCGKIYREWLQKVRWRASLLVLDEAHHAKNDETRLAGLFRSRETTELLTQDGQVQRDNRPLLWDKFDRMLFLTATPFQLGHHELMSVIRSFAAAKWSGRRAPSESRQYFVSKLEMLEQRLSENRLAGKRLDDWWGRIDNALIGSHRNQGIGMPDAVQAWWDSVEAVPGSGTVEEIKKAVTQCRETRANAESDPLDPWASLRAWVIRHNRPAMLPTDEHQQATPRREHRAGGAILTGENRKDQGVAGIPLTATEAVPFFIAARAQGELARNAGKGQRAFFAEGLCSSYEAFHHTREGRGDVREMNDEGVEGPRKERPVENRKDEVVPVRWYEEHIAQLIPTRDEKPERRFAHPKIRAVVRRAVELWLSGEKVLVFCFYRQTAMALRDHIKREVENASVRRLAERLGFEPSATAEIRERLAAITRRLADKDSPFHREILAYLNHQFDQSEFVALASRPDLKQRLLDLLAAYVRSASYVSRYFPLEVPEVRETLIEGRVGATTVHKGVEAMRKALDSSSDISNMSLTKRISEFLRFALGLAEKEGQAGPTIDGDAPPTTQLEEYLNAISDYVTPSGTIDDDDPDDRPSEILRANLRVVRLVYGDTKMKVRQRVMLAFNSPLFPEILVSSAVLGEGVDLHRFCRYLIHHDLCWNPSTLEQKTGRLDRIRCKAEIICRPIVIYEPFIAGSADEKMYRVVKDRERWFQIVMGQKFEFDEKTAEDLAWRVPLPETLSRSLIFDLRRYRPESQQPSLAQAAKLCNDPEANLTTTQLSMTVQRI
jgi:superfamily II DNA or RNA helicase